MTESDRFGYSPDEWEAAVAAGYEVLVGAATRQSSIDYTQFCDETFQRCGVRFVPGEYALPHLLGDVSTKSRADDGVLLTVLVVYRSGPHQGEPGPGFFQLARHLGLLASTSKAAEDRFYARHMEAVLDKWKVRRRGRW